MLASIAGNITSDNKNGTSDGWVGIREPYKKTAGGESSVTHTELNCLHTSSIRASRRLKYIIAINSRGGVDSDHPHHISVITFVIRFSSSGLKAEYRGKHNTFAAASVATGKLQRCAEGKPLYMGKSEIKG